MGFKAAGGVLVSEVSPRSFAEDLGIAENDVIISINRQPVASVADVQRIQGTLKPGDPVVFHVMRAPGLPAQRRGQNGAGAAVEWRSFFPAGTMPNNP